MSFTTPLGLLGLLAVPAIILIHLYHRRFPRLMVAGLHLWGAEVRVQTAGRRRERLPITASLLLELLAATLLSLLLAGPRFGDVGQVTHLVIVLDNSASMSAKPAGTDGRSLRDQAIAEITNRAEQLRRGSVITLVLTGQRPVMLAGPAVAWQDARTALTDWRPALPRHDFQAAWDLAAQLAGDAGQLLFVTDHVPSANVPLPKHMEIVSVGRAVDNVAITAARWSFNSTTNQGSIFLRVRNLGRAAADVTVLGSVEQRTVFRHPMTIAPGAEVPLETAVAVGLGQVDIELQTRNDGLAIDSSVTLIEPKVRMLTVANVLELGTAARRLTDRVIQSSPDVQPGPPETCHLLIGPGGRLPPSQDSLWWLGVGPIDPSESARKAARDLIGPYLIEKRHPLLDGLVLGGVVWGGVQPVQLDVTPLISAGSFPLLARLNGTRTTAFLLNIDLDRSNLGDSPDWPILLSNMIELRRNRLPGLRRWNYRLNEPVRFRLYEGRDTAAANSEQQLVLVHHEQERPLARSALVELPLLDRTGVYTIRDGDRTIGQFAVNFHDVAESTLTDLRPGARAPEVPAAANGFAVDRPLSWIVLLAILLVLVTAFADWYVLKPRRMTG